MSVHLETVAAGLAPGGMWMRVCADHELIIERGLELIIERGLASIELASRLGDRDAERVRPYLERGETVRSYFYDGDTGRCLATIVTEPRKK